MEHVRACPSLLWAIDRSMRKIHTERPRDSVDTVEPNTIALQALTIFRCRLNMSLSLQC